MNKPSISRLLSVLGRLRSMNMLLQVGLNRNFPKNKIDLLAGCKSGNIERWSSPVMQLLEQEWPSGKFSVCDDSVRFNLNEFSGGVAICDSNTILQQVSGWVSGKNLEGQRRPWAIGYWLPEALCGDIATANVLIDMMGIGIQLKRLTVPYQSSLSQGIIDLCITEIRHKLDAVEKLHREKSNIEFRLCISDITHSMVRLAFARSHIYLRGFRFLDEQAKLLRLSDVPVFKLATSLSKSKRVAGLIGKIEGVL